MRQFTFFRRLVNFFTFCSLFFIPAGSYANSTGGYISYKLISTDSADIYLTFYRNCTGIPINPNPQVTVSQGATTQNHTLSRTSIIDVTDFCATSKSLCNGGSVAGYQENKYVKRISLAAFNSTSLIKISYQECCFSGSLANITGGNFYTESFFMKGVTENEGPLFAFTPLLVLNGGIPNSYNVKITNKGSDSIVYALLPALLDAATSATYSNGFTALRPFPYTGAPSVPLQFDNETGQLKAGSTESFTPVGSTAYYILTYGITRYRNGVKIGEVRVCHEVLVLNSGGNNNQTPVISMASATYKVCAGTPICFDVFTSDPNAADSTSIIWDKSIPGASFQSSNAKNAKGRFCWTPTNSDIKSTPYYVAFKTSDNGCPKRAGAVKVVTILVSASTTPISATAGMSYSYCDGKASYQSNVTSGPGGTYQYQWAGTGNFSASTSSGSYTYGSAGKHYFTLRISSPSACGDALINDSVAIPVHIPLSVVTINGKTDTMACSGAPLLLTASPLGGKQPYSYSWNGGTPGAVNSFVFQSTQSGVVTLSVTDSFGCSKTAQINVGIRSLPQVNILVPDTSVCYNSGNLNLAATPAGGNWSSSSTCLATNVFTPKLACSGSNVLVYGYTDGYGCVQQDTLKVTVLNFIHSQTGIYSPVCSNAGVVQLNGTPANGTWSGNGIMGDKFYPSSAGVGTHSITYQAAGGCGTLATTYINVLYSAAITFTNPSPAFCETSNQGYVFASPSGGYWTGNHIQSNGTFLPSAAGAGNHIVTYNYVYNNGCLSKDSVYVSVIKQHVVNAGADRDACKNAGDIVLNGSPASGTWSGTSVTGDKFNTAVAAGTYKLVYTSSNGVCTNKDTMQVRVLSADFYSMSIVGIAPFNVNFINSSTPGFSGYLWNFGDTASGAANTSTQATPSHTFQNSGNYTITLVANSQAGSCSSTVVRNSYIWVDPNSVFDVPGRVRLMVYPNPSTGDEVHVNLTGAAPASEVFTLYVYDMAGHLVYSKTIHANSEHTLPVEGKGLFVLQVQDAQGKTETRKFLMR